MIQTISDHPTLQLILFTLFIIAIVALLSA